MQKYNVLAVSMSVMTTSMMSAPSRCAIRCGLRRSSMLVAMVANSVTIIIYKIVTNAIIILVPIAMIVANSVTIIIHKAMTVIIAITVTVRVQKTFAHK